MPISRKSDGWYWGSKGPFQTRAKAVAVGAAAHAAGYQEATVTSTAAGEFVVTLLHSATITHMMHFRVTGPGSYSAHKALQKYYENIVDLVDSLAESIQGSTSQLIDFATPANIGETANPL
jgi:hypothetical protein